MPRTVHDRGEGAAVDGERRVVRGGAARLREDSAAPVRDEGGVDGGVFKKRPQKRRERLPPPRRGQRPRRVAG